MLGVLLAYLLGTLGSAWHEAFVRHEICDHGAFVEVAGDSGGCAVEPTHAHPGEARAAAPRGESGGEEHGHAHCSIVATTRRAAPVGLVACTVSVPLEASRPAPPVTRTVERDFPLYLLAPHHSPPAA